MRASALFLSSGELSQASTANSKSCAYERLARRDGRLMRRETLPARNTADETLQHRIGPSPARRLVGGNRGGRSGFFPFTPHHAPARARVHALVV
eukprot:scaffold30849_cov75-Phaeocystis_antarctica.AAC.5